MIFWYSQIGKIHTLAGMDVLVDAMLRLGFFPVVRGNEFGALGEFEQFVQDSLPVGFKNRAPSNEQDVEVAGKIGTEVAVGFAQAAPCTISLVGAQAHFFAGDNP